MKNAKTVLPVIDEKLEKTNESNESDKAKCYDHSNTNNLNEE